MLDIYGSDCSTFVGDSVDIDPLFAEFRGERVVLEHCARCLMTDTGSLPGAPEFGFNLTTLIGKRMTGTTRARMKDRIKTALERIQGVLTATVARFDELAPNSWRISISIGLASGPFTLVLSVSEVTVSILKVNRG